MSWAIRWELASRFNWQTDPPETSLICEAQIRARHKAVAARIQALPDGQARVDFDEPVSAVTPGQVVTVYDGDLVIGGGWIDRALDTSRPSLLDILDS